MRVAPFVRVFQGVHLNCVQQCLGVVLDLQLDHLRQVVPLGALATASPPGRDQGGLLLTGTLVAAIDAVVAEVVLGTVTGPGGTVPAVA